MKFMEFAYQWLEKHSVDIKHGTYLKYESCLKNQIAASPIADKEIEQITHNDIVEFMAFLKGRASRKTGRPLVAGTVNDCYIVVQSVFGFALDRELIAASPCVRIKRMPHNPYLEKVKCFTPAERKKMEKYIENEGTSVCYAFYLSMYTGLRIGELCALKWEDIHFDEKMLSVTRNKSVRRMEDGTWIFEEQTPKTRTSYRDIPLPDHVLARLKELRKQSTSPSVFVQSNGKPLSNSVCRYQFEKMLEKTGIRKLNFHCLRHTFASCALERGADPKSLAEVMGHSDPSITLNVYAHTNLDQKRKMMNLMKPE